MIERLRIAGLTATLSMFATTSVWGQAASHRRASDGETLVARAVSMDSTRRVCLSLVRSPWSKEVLELPCRVTAFNEIARAAGKRWLLARYARLSVFPATETTPADTLHETELVLFTAPLRATRLTPLWRSRFEDNVLASMTPTIVARQGGAFVSIQECLNGTGGCDQSFLMYRDGRWRRIRAAFLDSLLRRFPQSMWKGFQLDPRTFRASVPLYVESDANCCPSKLAHVTVGLRGDALEMLTLELVERVPRE
jgi:hypothetical protein